MANAPLIIPKQYIESPLLVFIIPFVYPSPLALTLARPGFTGEKKCCISRMMPKVIRLDLRL